MIKEFLINESFIEYLEKRGLSQQYKNKKEAILAGRLQQAGFKLREPKKDKVYYFRINKQYRVIGKIFGETFKVLNIDNHS